MRTYFSSTPVQSLSVGGGGSCPGTPLDSSLAGSGVDEEYDIDEDSNIVEDDYEYKSEAMESMPERIPKIKRYLHNVLLYQLSVLLPIKNYLVFV